MTLLLSWVNSPDSLDNKLITKNIVALKEHSEWLNESLKDPNTRIWILENKPSNEPIGQMRLVNCRTHIEIDIYIVRHARKKGKGKNMLDVLIVKSNELWPDIPIRAKILNKNSISLKLFSSCGFVCIEKHEDYSLLEYKVNDQ
tara:strand:+ start:218 stop:649 length:432 start_codon:yes stop_codon:yes gene_type:complete